MFAQTSKEVVQKASHVPSRLHVFTALSSLAVNPRKMNFMVFSRTGVPQLLENVLYNGVSITQVFFLKYLGFYIDCNLSWKKHGEIVSAKAARGLGVIRRLKKCSR